MPPMLGSKVSLDPPETRPRRHHVPLPMNERRHDVHSMLTKTPPKTSSHKASLGYRDSYIASVSSAYLPVMQRGINECISHLKSSWTCEDFIKGYRFLIQMFFISLRWYSEDSYRCFGSFSLVSAWYKTKHICVLLMNMGNYKPFTHIFNNLLK